MTDPLPLLLKRLSKALRDPRHRAAALRIIRLLRLQRFDPLFQRAVPQRTAPTRQTHNPAPRQVSADEIRARARQLDTRRRDIDRDVRSRD